MEYSTHNKYEIKQSLPFINYFIIKFLQSIFDLLVDLLPQKKNNNIRNKAKKRHQSQRRLQKTILFGGGGDGLQHLSQIHICKKI